MSYSLTLFSLPHTLCCGKNEHNMKWTVLTICVIQFKVNMFSVFCVPYHILFQKFFMQIWNAVFDRITTLLPCPREFVILHLISVGYWSYGLIQLSTALVLGKPFLLSFCLFVCLFLLLRQDFLFCRPEQAGLKLRDPEICLLLHP